MFQISYDLVDWDNSINQAFGILGRVSDVGLTLAAWVLTPRLTITWQWCRSRRL